MTRLTLSTISNALPDWIGYIFDFNAPPVVATRTATNFTFSHAATDSFPGYKVIVTGTAFTYLNGEPTGGNITRVVVTNAVNQPIMVLDTFTANTLASDLAQFATDIFGWSDPYGGGQGSSGYRVWSRVLSGNDLIVGTAGDDEVHQGVNGGNDTYNMNAGNDWIVGGIGSDTINGGDGSDGITFYNSSYSTGDSAFRGISVNMVTGKLIDCWGYTDTFTGIEKIEGSRFNDVILGSAGDEKFWGFRGADTFYGGGGNDFVYYRDDARYGGLRGIIANLETSVVGTTINGTIRDGFGQIDRIVNIHGVVGTRYNDIFLGSREADYFSGGEGIDLYNGKGGNDYIDFDARFGDQTQVGVVVNLKLAANQITNDGYGNIETAISIEHILGSAFNDRITMTLGNDTVSGYDGRDTLSGGGGSDHFEWKYASEFVTIDAITDFAATGVATNIDKLGFDVSSFVGMTTTLRLVNGTAATIAAGQFVYNTINDTLYWDSDGTGIAAKVAVVQLLGVNALSAVNFDLF
ncbi:MAG: calcium-binding protein [Paracoccaceae bacterium]